MPALAIASSQRNILILERIRLILLIKEEKKQPQPKKVVKFDLQVSNK